ncbi:hypothetical protein J4401_05180 [Candidatus Woesearchaeota archaeon]|nr:hypothetical protein [Candidatus Woesearchaeota archaeon]
MEGQKTTKTFIWLLAIAFVIILFNAYQIQSVKGMRGSILFSAAQYGNAQAGGTLASPESVSGILPAGIPEIYGKELGISFDDVSADNPRLADATISKLGKMDIDIILNEEQKKRFINILYKMENGISCEYCCGARAVIFENGEPACGCAHSYAMRGLTKYLLTKHADEYTDGQMLEEAGKWKVLFFPGVHEQKAAILKEKGVELNYINLASNKYRGIEQGTSSGGQMVGGC